MPDTLIRIFLDCVETRDKSAQFMRKTANGWESIPARRSLADVEALALGLAALGVQRGDRVALLSENRYEWAVSDLAILGLGAVTVPIYPTLIAQQVRYVLENAEARVVIVSTPAQLDKLHQIAESLPRLEAIIAMEPAPPTSGRSRSFADVQAQGAKLRESDPGAFRRHADAVRPDDIATIIYTSGTTGDPKGAMLTHANVCANVAASLQVVALHQHQACISFLPLCHILERMAGQFCMLQAGVTIAYAQSLATVAADAQEVPPTVLAGVPRLFEKAYARVMDNSRTQPLVKRLIFSWGVRVGIRAARMRFAGQKPAGFLAMQAHLADRLVGAKVRERVGGRLRLCVSGGAPLAPKIMEFFFAIGIPVIEGYGLTETSPVICLNPPGRERPGSVGPPLPGVEVAIGDEGEILTRGPQVFLGYWNNPEATRNAFVEIGGKRWFRTGDLGRVDEDGYFFMVDRLKRMINASGFKVWPAEVEALMYEHPAIQEACVIGAKDAHRGETVKAIVVIKEAQRGKVSEQDIIDWARQNMAAYKSPRIVEFVDSLPKSATGKVMWRALQEKEAAGA